jgi:hypothetical protein
VRNAHNVLVGKLKGTARLGERRIREDNIRMDVKEVVCECVGWSRLVQDIAQWRARVSTAMGLVCVWGGGGRVP